MRTDVTVDETLLSRLPLPLAQFYRRAHNATTACPVGFIAGNDGRRRI